MRSIATIALSALLFLAGCSSPSGEDSPTPTVPAPPPSPFDLVNGFQVPFDGTGCMDGLVVLLVTFDQAKKSLPPGYEPADAQVLLASPVATDNAAVGVTSIVCGQSSFNGTSLSLGEVMVLVKPPAATGNLSKATFDLYQVASYTNNEGLMEVYDAVGLPYFEAAIETKMTKQPTGSVTGSGKVADEEGTVFTYGVTGLQPDKFTGLVRFWHETANGTLITDYEYKTEQEVGNGNPSCTLTEGKPAAVAAGTTTCQAGKSLALGLPNETWTGWIRYVPRQGNTTA